MISGNVADDCKVERSSSSTLLRATVLSRSAFSLSVLGLSFSLSLSLALSLLEHFLAVDFCKIASNSDRGLMTMEEICAYVVLPQEVEGQEGDADAGKAAIEGLVGEAARFAGGSNGGRRPRKLRDNSN
ncbi:hypothetical protein L484_023866 [Morus notabilis]|uniref:Uncharacterized protein n=1 Tax=Morus notabilis TaxID=981085 RepID=W9RDH8_9ROSA|nr:hypothetical protein L484_023866 [Morus notabilis]